MRHPLLPTLLLIPVVITATACTRSDRIPPRQNHMMNGDAPANTPNPGATSDETEIVTEWPFRPDTMRVHPLTRVRRPADGMPIIEVWIEFNDRWGDPTKALGKLEVDLAGMDGRRETFITQWLLDLRVLDDNDRYWDNVTRMYLFRLEPDPGTVVPDTIRVRALFLSTEGLTLDGAVDVP